MKVDVLGVNIDNITMNKATETILSAVDESLPFSVFTPNAEMVMEAYSDNDFLSIINSASMVVPDGSGVILGAKFLGKDIKEKVAGVELVQSILESGKELSVFIYGGKPGKAAKAAKNIESEYAGIHVCGTEHGYISEEKNGFLTEKISCSDPDIVLVGLGVPRQEKWIASNSDKISKTVFIGCGGTIDILSGESRRAPSFFIKLHLEWLYRLIREPRRLPRMMRIPLFLFLCLKKRISG